MAQLAAVDSCAIAENGASTTQENRLPPEPPLEPPQLSPTTSHSNERDGEEFGFRREQSALFPPLTNTPLTLHSYRDSSVSSLMFGLLCCLLNIALYLVSGEISRLLQQEKELQRHQSLHYVCPPQVDDEHGLLMEPPGPSDPLNRDKNRAAPCTIRSADSDVKTRVVVLNIPYFMSWCSQSLQFCFLFFAIAAIKRRRRRPQGNRINPLPSFRHIHGLSRCSSGAQEGGGPSDCGPSSPRGSTHVVQLTEELCKMDIRQRGEYFPLDRSEGRISAASCSDDPGRRTAMQPQIVCEASDKSEGVGTDEVSCSALKGVYPPLETDADYDAGVIPTQQQPGQHPFPRKSKNTTSGVLSNPLGCGSAEKDLHQPLISSEATTAGTGPTCMQRVAGKDVSNFIDNGIETGDGKDSAEKVRWATNVEEVLLYSALQEHRETHMANGCNSERHCAVSRRHSDSDAYTERNLSQTEDLQEQEATLPEESKWSRVRTLPVSWMGVVGSGLAHFNAETVEALWMHHIQPRFSRYIGAPLQQYICTPYVRDTYRIVKDFVEADLQYSSFKELIWACMWIGALYLLHSWTWTLAVGTDGMSVGTVTAIYNMNPVFVFLFTVLLYKEGTEDCVQIAALVLATVGVAAIAYNNEGEPTSTSGVLLSVACAATYGLFEVVYKNYILNGKSNLPLAFIFLIVGIIGMLSLCVFWIPLACLHIFSLEVFPGSTPPPFLIFLLIVVCVCSCLHTLLLQVSLLLLPSPILVALCSLLSLPAAAAADWLNGGGGGVGGIGTFFIASAFFITSVNEWRIQRQEKARTYRRLISLAELHPREYAELRKLVELPDLPQPRYRHRPPLFGRASEAEPPEESEPSLESIAAHLVAQKKDEDVGAELKEVLCVFAAPADDEFFIAENATTVL
ncbi:multidrug resistance efflux transporter [Toxoplasma gondii ARI]|uniref:Multidrug resistance efflux transporter n=1 Tax=Toxoplasma gondii ARI TaxID=1074872 RepID=A0A139XYB3_TOXGO|nr:multidrug resistance efflux transporter [Toxoplasma gondii ARI]